MTSLKGPPIRVGFLGSSILSGGAEHWMLNLARFCDPARIRWTLCLIAHHWSDAAIRDAIAAIVPVYHEGRLHSRDGIESCATGDAIRMLLTSSDVVLAWELDGMMQQWIEKTDAAIVNVAHRRDLTLAQYVSDGHHLAAVWDNCRASFGSHRESSVHVIPNGVDLNRCFPLRPRQEIRNTWACSQADLVIGYIGRLSREKNCTALARAVKGLKHRAMGVVYGSRTAQGDEIVSEIRSIAGSAIRFFQPVEDVGSILHAIDVFLLPSHTEGLSLSLLEAWASGVPVVATAVGALPEIEQRFGPLTVGIEPNASEASLATAVLEAVHGTARHGIARRAQKMVFNYFNALIMATAWTDHLASIVDCQRTTQG